MHCVVELIQKIRKQLRVGRGPRLQTIDENRRHEAIAGRVVGEFLLKQGRDTLDEMSI